MSRFGSCDSSAASGSSSIARKNQIANGIAWKIPLMPNGRNDVPPSSGGMLLSRLKSRSPDANCGDPEEHEDRERGDVDATVNRIVASIPTMLSATKMT